MNGLSWEIKTPTGKNSRTVENILRDGVRQSQNIVLDMRFTTRTDKQCIAEARERFRRVTRLRRLLIIRKTPRR